MTGIFALGPLCCFVVSRPHAELPFRVGDIIIVLWDPTQTFASV